MSYKFSRYNQISKLKDTEDYLLYNFYSNGLIRINNEYKNKFENDQISDNMFKEDEIKILSDNGFIVDKNLNEINRLILNYNKTYMNSPVLSLTILPTLDCNFRCPYCFEGLDKPKAYMQSETVEKLQEFIEFRLSTNPNIKHINLEFYGGEPLLNKNVLQELGKMFMGIEHKHKITYDGSIITNGFLLDEEITEILNNSLHVHEAMITLDGHKEIHNSRRLHHDPEVTDTYTPIVNNIIRFCRLKAENNVVLRTHTYMNDSEINVLLEDFPEDVKKRLHIQLVELFTDKQTYTKEETADKYKDYVDFSFGRKISTCNECYSPESYIISADGNVYFCKYQNFIPENNKLLLGNLDNFKEIYTSTNYYNIYGCYFFNKVNCLQCNFLPICSGGCKIKDYQNINEHGKEDCPIKGYYIRNVDFDLNNLYIKQTSK